MVDYSCFVKNAERKTLKMQYSVETAVKDWKKKLKKQK